MSELYAITITGIVASDIGDPADSWTDASLPDLVKTLFDRDVKSILFATHHNGRIVVEYSKPSETPVPIPDPNNIINDALDDANGFYEMFEGTEGVEERVERLHQAMELMDTPTSVIVKVNAFDDTGFASHEEADDPNVPDTCSECGQSFERHHHQQKYCGDVCRKARNARWYRETYAKEVK